MRTLMAVLADRAEEVDGKGSVIGIFQAVTAQRFPTTLSGVLALRFTFVEPEDAESEGVILETRFIGRDGSQLAKGHVADAVPAKTPVQPLRGIDIRIDLRGTLLPVPGVYRIE